MFCARAKKRPILPVPVGWGSVRNCGAGIRSVVMLTPCVGGCRVLSDSNTALGRLHTQAPRLHSAPRTGCEVAKASARGAPAVKPDLEPRGTHAERGLRWSRGWVP